MSRAESRGIFNTGHVSIEVDFFCCSCEDQLWFKYGQCIIHSYNDAHRKFNFTRSQINALILLTPWKAKICRNFKFNK